jgi:hypothetical protein
VRLDAAPELRGQHQETRIIRGIEDGAARDRIDPDLRRSGEQDRRKNGQHGRRDRDDDLDRVKTIIGYFWVRWRRDRRRRGQNRIAQGRNGRGYFRDTVPQLDDLLRLSGRRAQQLDDAGGG